MADRSHIEWTDATWNPIRGCTRVSPGCVNCYAEIMAARFSKPGQWGHGFAHILRDRDGKAVDHRWTGKVALNEDQLDLPLTWRAPRRVFVNSTSDLFHVALPDGAIMRVFQAMAMAPQHDYQVLTKRPDRALAFCRKWADLEGEGDHPRMVRGPAATRAVHPSGRGQLFADMLDAMGEPPPGAAFPTFDWMNGMRWWPDVFANVWLGASVEDQARADERRGPMAELAAMGWPTFVSHEPALGPVDWSGWEFLRWLIAGGESGPGSRPMHPDWPRADRDFCAAHGVAFFFKQWGDHREFFWDHPETVAVDADSAFATALRNEAVHRCWISAAGETFRRIEDLPADESPCRLMERVGKRAAGRLLDGVTHDALPGRFTAGPQSQPASAGG